MVNGRIPEVSSIPITVRTESCHADARHRNVRATITAAAPATRLRIRPTRASGSESSR